MKHKNPWKTLTNQSVYSNPWIEVIHNEVITPGGSPGIYGKVHYKNIAVGVIPLDKDYNTWIVGQYRYTMDCYSWEIPEGGCLDRSKPIEAAQRELKEETGLSAENWQEILYMHTSNSVCDEEAYLYVARELTMGQSEPEDTEDLALKKLPFEELAQMVHQGKIQDAMSIAAILKLDWMIGKGEI